MKDKKKIITLELDIKGDKKLKETINNLTTLDKATSTSAVLSSNLAKAFANFQDFCRPLGFAIPSLITEDF